MDAQPGDCILVDDHLPARRSLRVALVTETYPPEVNGVAASFARVVSGLLGRGHELQLVRPRQDRADTARSDGQMAEVLMRGLPIPRYPQLKMGLPSRRALVKLWTARRPDVVHIVTEGPLGWSALQAALQMRLPVVSDFRTNFHAYSRHYGVAWLRAPIMAYLRKFHNRTACTMVPTDELRGELAAAGFKGLRVVSRGVDAQLFDPRHRSDTLRAGWGAGPGTTVALCVGRLAPEKNLGTLLAAVQAMRAEEPRLRLVLVGDGPEKAALMQCCPDAVFAGIRRGEDLAAHYASADVFLFPSLTETFGNVVLEAMASGLAVVAYDHAAAGQLLRHGDNGLLARRGDEPDFCRWARRLAGDLEHTRALGTQARQTALRHDWGHIVEAIETEYAAAMAAPGVHPALAWKPVLPAT
ncbi:MAG: glycosyltransferase family 1 protein [Rubrivivax sp.]|nr:glycosyltransferase family 1 protein [Rubrivivax sp.]